MAAASASTRAFGANVAKQSIQHREAFNTMGLAAVGFGAAVIGGLGLAAGAAMKFESSFAGVRKTVDGSEQDFRNLAEGMREMSLVKPVDVNDLNRIGELGGQLGIAKDNLVDFTGVIADLDVSTDMNIEDGALQLAQFANVTKMSQNDFDRLGSSVVALGNNFATTESRIVDFSQYIGGAGKIAGLAQSEILAIGAAMGSVGVAAESGGTATQKVLLGITEAVTTGSEKLDVFATTAGMSAKDFAAAWQADPAKAFTSFVEGLGRSGDDAFQILRQLGLTDQRLIRSFLSLSGAGDTLRRSIDLSNKAWDENSALTEEAGKRYATAESRIKMAKNEINDAAITVGATLLPALASGAELVGDLAGSISELPGPLRGVATVLGGVVGGVGLLGGGLLLLAPRISATKLALNQMGISLKGVRSGAALAKVGLGLLAMFAITEFVSSFAAADEAAGKLQARLTGGLSEGPEAAERMMRRFEKSVQDTVDEMGLLDTVGGLVPFIGDTSTADQKISSLRDGIRELRAEAESMSGVERDVALATAEWQAATVRLITAQDALGPEMAKSIGAEKDQKDAADELNAALARQAAETGEAAGAQGELGGQIDATTGEIEEQKTAAEQLEEALMSLAGLAIGVEESMLGWRDSLAALGASFKENGATLDANTEKGRANRRAVLDSRDAAIDHAKAIADQSGSAQKGEKVLAGHVKQLRAQMVAAGLTEREIDSYIRKLKLTPKQIRTLIQAETARAKAEIDEVRRRLFALPDTIPVHIAITSSKMPGGQLAGRAGGGPVPAGWTGWVGERGPEILRMGSQPGHITAAHDIRSSPAATAQEVAVLVKLQMTGEIRRLIRAEISQSGHRQGRVKRAKTNA
jgi:TP901 family phage tail tape measure protein